MAVGERTEERRLEPLETEELLQRRWAQRRVLRQMDDMYVRTAAGQTSISSPEMPRDRSTWLPIEILLRDEIERWVVDLDGPLGADRLSDSRRALSGFVNSNWPESLADRLFRAQDRVPTHPLRDFQDRLIEAAEQAEPRRSAEEDSTLAALASLLLWADKLADDGYEDHRVRDAQR